MTEAGNQRPKRVIIVDAENPLEEIHGEFFWREDHDVLLAAARDGAYRAGHDEGYRQGSDEAYRLGYEQGYNVGWAESARQHEQLAPQRLVVRRRRSLLRWVGLVRLVLVAMLLAAFAPLLVTMLLERLLAAR